MEYTKETAEVLIEIGAGIYGLTLIILMYLWEKRKEKQELLKKTKTLTFRLDENLSNKLTKVSLRDNISVGELCRNLLNGGLENENKNNKHKKSDR